MFKLIKLKGCNKLWIVGKYWADWSCDWEVLKEGDKNLCLNEAYKMCSKCCSCGLCNVEKDECKGFEKNGVL